MVSRDGKPLVSGMSQVRGDLECIACKKGAPTGAEILREMIKTSKGVEFTSNGHTPIMTTPIGDL